MNRRLLRYLAVGGLATAAHWALLALLVETGTAPPWLGTGAGALLGAQVAFFGNRRFTFDHAGALAPAWWRFMATAVAGGLLNMAIVGAGVALGLYYLLAQALATSSVVLATFAVNRHWTFAK
ncbi:MAG: GtrA family protein [Burkholderiales bacterium]|nr:GtrA family protein [Burkholderiales bacterium]MDE2454896.1 GtrA family protein [Burkholderiales bacterium]